MKTVTKMLALLTVTMMLTACGGSTQLIQSWYEDTYTGAEYLDTVLVLGIFRDDIQRRAFESKFVEQVKAGGKNAVAGYTLMPEQADYDEEREIASAVERTGADAVLITSYKGTAEQQRYVPPSVDYMPSMGYGYYGAYYGAAYRGVYSPGYTVVDTVVSLDTRVYAVEPDLLVWAGKTKSVNSASGDKIVEELVKIVVNDMRRNGLIK